MEQEIKHNKILRLGLQNRVVELKTQGKSYHEIAKIISKEAGTDISYGAVFRHFKDYKDSRNALIKHETKRLKVMVDKQINVIDELIDLKNKLSGYLDKQLEENTKMVPATANALTKQLEIIAKILGDIRIQHEHKTVHIETNIVSTKIGEILGRLRKAGKLYCKKCKSRDIAFDEGDMGLYEK